MFLEHKISTLGFVCVMLYILDSNVVSAITFEEDTTLSWEQKAILDKFRKLVYPRLTHDFMKQDIYLIKWLRSKHFDIPKAEKFLLETLEWRKQKKIDTIGEEDWSDVVHDYNYRLDGRDKFGRAILYIDVGNNDVRAAVIRDGERFLRYCDKVVEESCQLTRSLGEKYQNITRGHLMLNLNGYNTVQHGCLQCIPFLLRIVLSFRDHNPESLDKIIVLNAPSFVSPIVSTLRAVLSPQLQKRLKIYGKNQQIWKAEMGNDFDFTTLPPGAKTNYSAKDNDF